jgi:hypothetical protein
MMNIGRTQKNEHKLVGITAAVGIFALLPSDAFSAQQQEVSELKCDATNVLTLADGAQHELRNIRVRDRNPKTGALTCAADTDTSLSPFPLQSSGPKDETDKEKQTREALRTMFNFATEVTYIVEKTTDGKIIVKILEDTPY